MTDRKPEEKYQKLLKSNPQSAQKYKENVIDYLDGRHPEFARMSNGGNKHTKKEWKGGIGFPMLPALRHALETDWGCDLMAELHDVPDLIEIGGKPLLIGRYLKNKLREMVGVPDEWKEKKLLQMQAERIAEYAQYAEEFTEKEHFTSRLSQKDFLLEKNIQHVRDIEKRYEIQQSRSN